MCVRGERKSHLKKVRQYRGRRSQGNTSTSTSLSVCLTVSISLGGQEPLKFFFLWAVTHSDSKGSGSLLQVTHRSILPAAQMLHQGVTVLHQIHFRPVFANTTDTAGGEREEVKMKHEGELFPNVISSNHERCSSVGMTEEEWCPLFSHVLTSFCRPISPAVITREPLSEGMN